MALPSVVRQVGSSGPNPMAHRVIHRLSTVANGLFAVVGDMNQTGVTGDFGDNTAIAKIYTYYSADNGNTWTLKWTITTDVTSGNLMYSSMIDAADNLHITWRTLAGGVMYQYATWVSGTATLTAQTVKTLYTVAANVVVHNVDITTIGDAATPAYAIVVAEASDTVAGQKKSQILHYFIKVNTVFTMTTINVSTTDSLKQDQISVGGLKNTIASNTGIYVIALTGTFASAGDKGDYAWIVRVNTSTGAFISSGSVIPIVSAGKAAGRRAYCVFTSDTSNIVTIAGQWGNTQHFIWRFTVNTAGTRTDIVTARTLTLNPVPTTVNTADLNNWATFARNESGGFTYITYIMRTSYYAYAIGVAEISSTGAIVWQGNSAYVLNGNYYSVKPGPSLCNADRNVGPQPDILSWFDYATPYAVQYNRVGLALAGVTTSPSGTVSTATPTLKATFALPYRYAQASYKMTWQLATDAGFTTNVINFTQADSKFVSPQSTDPVNQATVTATDVLPQAQALPVQGTWYIRAAAVDFYGNRGAWSPAVTFMLAHPPVPTNLVPNLDKVLIYGSGNVTFGWKFTDPYKYDVQTAYDVVVQEAATGTVIVDSGKVSSTAASGVVTVPSSWKDDELQWSVSLWDGNDVQGVYADWQTFYVSDPPTPAFTYPTDALAITTGTPVVTWSSGTGAIKTQDGFRVVLTQGTKVLWDTGWKVGTDGAASMPAGLLHNGNSYSLQLQVRDSLGLVGQQTIGFTTAWTVPAQPPVFAYTYELERKGFVFIGWESMSTDDPDFYGWNLYRRALGDTDWTLLETVTDLLPANGYQDMAIAGSTTYQYMVTQVVNRFGDVVESNQGVSVTVKTLNTRYWILDSLGVLPGVPLFNATGDSLTDEHEEAVFTIIGGGRHVELGETLGATGSLDVQLRPHYMGFSAGVNTLLNPGMQSHGSNNSPDSWTIAGAGTIGTITLDYQGFMEPAPNGVLNNLFVTVDSIGNTSADFVSFVQDIPFANLPFVANGDKWVAGVWDALNPDVTVLQPSNSWYIKIEYKNSGGTVLSTDEAIASITENYEPSGSDVSVGRWRRWTRSLTVPAVAWNYVTVTFKLRSASATATPQFYIGGFSAMSGVSPLPYFDGDMKGCYWNGVPYISTSISNGFYKARDQFLDIKEFRELNRPVYVRNPFGDVWLASLGDVTSTPVPGTGNDDQLADISLPYREVGF